MEFPRTKVLTLILSADGYCGYLQMLYGMGYTIHHSAEHPRAITLPKGVLGYIETRDETANTYKFVIYGKTKRSHNNARVVYLTRQSKGE